MCYLCNTDLKANHNKDFFRCENIQGGARKSARPFFVRLGAGFSDVVEGSSMANVHTSHRGSKLFICLFTASSWELLSTLMQGILHALQLGMV